MARSLLIVTRQAPGAGLVAREALDIVLAGGAFDLPLGMLFLDDGVYQLLPGQPQVIEQRDVGANLQALELFGVEQLFVARRSLAQRGLLQQALTLDAELLDDAQLATLFERFDEVITL